MKHVSSQFYIAMHRRATFTCISYKDDDFSVTGENHLLQHLLIQPSPSKLITYFMNKIYQGAD